MGVGVCERERNRGVQREIEFNFFIQRVPECPQRTLLLSESVVVQLSKKRLHCHLQLQTNKRDTRPTWTQ